MKKGGILDKMGETYLTGTAQELLKLGDTTGMERLLEDVYKKNPGSVDKEDAEVDPINCFVRLLTDHGLDDYATRVDEHYIALMANESDEGSLENPWCPDSMDW